MISGILSEFQTIWIQIRPYLGPNYLQKQKTLADRVLQAADQVLQSFSSLLVNACLNPENCFEQILTWSIRSLT